MLTPAGGQFEAITASYARIQSSISKVDDIPKKQLAVEEQIRDVVQAAWPVLQGILRKIGGVLPAN